MNHETRNRVTQWQLQIQLNVGHQNTAETDEGLNRNLDASGWVRMSPDGLMHSKRCWDIFEFFFFLQKCERRGRDTAGSTAGLSEDPALDSPPDEEDDACPQPGLLLIPAGFRPELMGDPAQVASNKFPIRKALLFFRLGRVIRIIR